MNCCRAGGHLRRSPSEVANGARGLRPSWRCARHLRPTSSRTPSSTVRRQRGTVTACARGASPHEGVRLLTRWEYLVVPLKDAAGLEEEFERVDAGPPQRTRIRGLGGRRCVPEAGRPHRLAGGAAQAAGRVGRSPAGGHADVNIGTPRDWGRRIKGPLAGDVAAVEENGGGVGDRVARGSRDRTAGTGAARMMGVSSVRSRHRIIPRTGASR